MSSALPLVLKVESQRTIHCSVGGKILEILSTCSFYDILCKFSPSFMCICINACKNTIKALIYKQMLNVYGNGKLKKFLLDISPLSHNMVTQTQVSIQGVQGHRESQTIENHGQFKNEIKQSHLHQHQRHIKYLGIHLTKKFEVCSLKNTKYLLEEIKGDLHKWQSIPCSGVGGSEALLYIAEKIIFLTIIYRYKEFPIRVSADFFLKNES